MAATNVTIIDGSGCVLGRLASTVAPRLLDGEEIHIVNAEKAIVTGPKVRIMEKYGWKRDVGTSRKGPFFPRMPHKIVKRTVRGMLPREKSKGKAAYKRLKCHIGVPAELEGLDMETPEKALPKGTRLEHMTIEDLSRSLGAKV